MVIQQNIFVFTQKALSGANESLTVMLHSAVVGQKLTKLILSSTMQPVVQPPPP